MSLDPGNVCDAIELARRTISQTSTFQTWVEASSAEQAYASTFAWDVPPELQINEGAFDLSQAVIRRPFAMIRPASDMAVTAEEIAEGVLDERVTLMAMFEDNVPEAIAADNAAICDRFFRRLAGVWKDVAALARTNPGSVQCYERRTLLMWDRIDKKRRATYGDHVWALVGLVVRGPI